ncbi:unnamed protein product [Cochlearia groenlandica]
MNKSYYIRSFLPLIVSILYVHLSHTTLSSLETGAIINVDVSQAHKLLDSGDTFLDVRTVEEFKKGHVDSNKIINVPYWFYTPQGGHEINPNFLKHLLSLCNQTDHLVLGCKSGVRSLYATKDLVSYGFKNVINMEGGYITWVNKRFPVKMEHK